MEWRNDWARTMAVDLDSPHFLARDVLPSMKGRDRDAIVSPDPRNRLRRIATQPPT